MNVERNIEHWLLRDRTRGEYYGFSFVRINVNFTVLLVVDEWTVSKVYLAKKYIEFRWKYSKYFNFSS